MGNSFSEFRKFWPAIVQWYPPKPKFNVDQIPDLTGRVVIVTGIFRASMPNLYLDAENDTSYRRLCWYWIRNYQGIPAVSASDGIVLTREMPLSGPTSA